MLICFLLVDIRSENRVLLSRVRLKILSSYSPEFTLIFRHMHEEEEIRYVISGSGYFDVRGNVALPPCFFIY